ncbi:Ectopic P granules protein 5 [Amphibalanus amphitrite]|uniref:Ectopic P granules protein 5 n=1 Tax=Amphibalanus amphitrite TaxID=1232801 RepID=A0A6A4VNJ5_AMPAM|nr:Ectopic P granules protein 5 [Amphibalanus amphitrite]
MIVIFRYSNSYHFACCQTSESMEAVKKPKGKSKQSGATVPAGELVSLCSTDASETCGSPFTTLTMPAAVERLYPELETPPAEADERCSWPQEQEEQFEPSAPAADEAVPLALTASQVSISEGPFSFETEQKDPLSFLGRDVVPMTDAQLADFYHNEELRRRDEYAAHFVSQYGPSAQPDDELASLLEGYRRAGSALRAAARRQAQLHSDYESRRSKCWELVRKTVRGEAECDDGRTLSATHEFRSASLDSVALQSLREALSALRRLLYDEYGLHAYSVLLARLQVETYLHTTVGRLPEVTAPPPAAPRLHYETPGQEAAAAALRACCAVLFAQQRRRAETVFTQQTRRWLLQVAAPLLRLGTVNDHLFVLHQALRCPSGSAGWTAALLQPPRPDLPAGLDHALTVLAALLSPVRERDKFLVHLHGSAPDPEQREDGEDEEWVLLEDEDSEAEKTAGFVKLQEADLVTLFNQLPWGAVVRHLLRMGRGPDGGDVYNAAVSSSSDILRLFACASQIIGLLAAGLAEYSGAAHKQLNKRMCHQLLHLVHYVTDHWESYIMASADDMATRGRLMVEYDSFMCRSAVSVLCSPRLAVWHFLASFPFGRLTARTSWRLLWLFHTSGRPQETADMPAVPHDQDDVWAAEIFSPTFHSLFVHQLVHMSQSEVYFRLTALANMAMARDARERTFIKAVTRDLVQVSFVTPTTRELCSRSGRDLLAATCTRHPFVISYVLSLTQENLHTMGKSALFLFSGLPLGLWRPSGSDLAQVCAWLTDHAVDSVESGLAQLVLARLDWDVRPYSGQLTLPAEFHRRAALATVGAQAARAPELSRAPGLVGEGRRQAGALAALVADSAERRFQDWAWAQVARLKLHAVDQPDAAGGRTEMMARLPRPDDPEVSALEEARRRDQPLACYATLLMTSEGHSLPALHGSGLSRLAGLVSCGRPAAVAHLLEVILPLFVGSAEELCAGPLPSLLQTIVSADQTYLRMMKQLVTASQPGPLILQVAGVIEGHVTAPRCYGQPSAEPLVALWLRALTCLPGWSREPALLYLLNQLLRAAFCRPPARKRAENIVSELIAVPWLAWFWLRAETRAEVDSGLWHDLIATLCEDRRLPLDQALKRVCSQQRLPQTPVQQLALYRWAQQALDTDLDCPLLPALWQHFFSLYLARVYDVNGRDLGSAGDRFMEGLVNVQYMKRLKRRLQETAEHYTTRAEEAGTREGHVIDGEVEQLQRLARLFGTFSLWLEEPRLHRPDVSLPDLPATYNPSKLIELLENAPLGEVWEEYINYWVESRLSDACLRQRVASHHDHRSGGAAGGVTPVRSDDTPAHRIVKRLQSYDARVGPPPLQRLDTPVPRQTAAMFGGPEAALGALRQPFAELAKYAR